VQMKVSVLIPTYNRAYIVGEALESALAQTHQDFEIIVIDDGSTDNTRELVEGFRSDKIRYVRLERNRGNSVACNTGIRAATGAGIAFLDSDDIWRPTNLERQVGFLLRHPEVDAVFTDCTIVDGEQTIPSLISLMQAFPKLIKGKLKGDEYVVSSREMYLCLLQEVPIKPTTVLVKRELYDRVGFFDESRPFADWDLFLRFSRSGTFGYIDLPLAVQRRTGDALHQQFREEDKIFLLELFLKEKASLKQDAEAVTSVNRGISSHCTYLGGLYHRSGDRRKSLRAYLRGFKETREPLLLLRAASVFLPLGL
jgi:glycosyltransferase involved in cell wall biosynthesis